MLGQTGGQRLEVGKEEAFPKKNFCSRMGQ